MSDASANVGCFWQQIPHADGEALTSQVTFDDRSSCTPILTGLVFGAYKFRLEVTDASGLKASADFPVGAVAYDENCVVIYPDDRLNELIGPQKALGCGPWDYVDQRHWALSRELGNRLKIHGGSWQSPAHKKDINGLPIQGAVYWSETTSPRTIYGIGTNFQDVFCGGQPGDAPNDSEFQEWIVPIATDPDWGGSNGLERQIAFRVDSCVSNTEIRVSYPGVTETTNDITVASPGVPWGVYWHNWYPNNQAGTVYIDNGSTTLHGTGTALQTFFCQGGTKPITNAIIWIYNGTNMIRHGVASCTSETEVTLASAYAGTTISPPGNHYVPFGPYPDLGEWHSTATNNSFYYDTPAAHYRMWYRSGDIQARDSARYGATNLLSTPYYGAISQPRSEILISPFVAAVVDTDAWHGKDPWPAIIDRLNYRVNGVSFINRDFFEQRDNAYFVWEVAQAARWHPDSAVRNAMNAALVNHYNWQAVPYQGKLGNYYGYAGDARKDTGRVWKVESGSNLVTLASGTAIDSSYCGVAFQPGGTISIAADKVTVTGTGTNFSGAGGKYILLRGTLNGDPYLTVSRIADSPTPTATGMTLVYPWRGDDGSVTSFFVYLSGYPVVTWEHLTAAGATLSPRVLDTDEQYWCTYQSPTSIRLDRPYTGDTSGGDYRRALGNGAPLFAVTYNQPFMDGLRAQAYYAAYKALSGYNSAVAAGYFTRMGEILDFLYSTARKSDTKGLPYFSYIPICRPYGSPGSVCEVDPDNNSDRDYWMESINAFSQHYLETKSESELARGDTIFTWLYAKPGLSAPTPGDGHYSTYMETASPAARAKAFGQGFGHGGGSTWPAARVGGPQASVPRIATVGFNLASIDGAAESRIRLLNASGGTSMHPCGAVSPCPVPIDQRLGGYWLQIQYLSESGKILTISDPRLFDTLSH